MKAIRLVPGKSLPQALRIEELETPSPGPGEVLVRMRAASLNYRDLIVAEGSLGGAQQAEPLIPLSDSVGEIAATGKDVTRWRDGDRVMGSFFQDWLDGPFLPEHM